ncbi:MAG TPA: uridine kinase [Cellulomonas sp.]|uniref:uridine kinase n=1 Tax=Cellulomonas sp. TaxID=40001 RepID=UPI002E30A7C1|nr:uridine kinase [Cellulomonas sp.]HEX5333525.1 uridine kinase [Cellulomonas sp.]
MRFQPMSTDALVEHVVALVLQRAADRRWRLAVDGPPVTRPRDLADALVAPLRAHGRPVVRAHADDFLRPASLRWEHGRRDVDAFYSDRLDLGAMSRELLDPLGPDGTGRYVPSFWDAALERATRAPHEQAAPGAILVLDGSLLLGRGLALDLVVHLSVRPETLARKTPPDARWTLPAFTRYAEEAAPEVVADVVVRVDDPRHPAVRFDP